MGIGVNEKKYLSFHPLTFGFLVISLSISVIRAIYVHHVVCVAPHQEHPRPRASMTLPKDVKK